MVVFICRYSCAALTSILSLINQHPESHVDR